MTVSTSLPTPNPKHEKEPAKDAVSVKDARAPEKEVKLEHCLDSLQHPDKHPIIKESLAQLSFGKSKLQNGTSGAVVKFVQEQLNAWRTEQGLEAIPETGHYRGITRKAVIEYQRANGLKPDGVIGPRTIGSLAENRGFLCALPALEREVVLPKIQNREVCLRYGQIGDSVSWLQEKLGLKQTGYFDAGTKNAVKAFQKQNGLNDDGVIGHRTLAKLTSESFPSQDSEPGKERTASAPSAQKPNPEHTHIIYDSPHSSAEHRLDTQVVTGYLGGKKFNFEAVTLEKGITLEKSAAEAFLRMREAAARNGVELRPNGLNASTFRTFEQQQELFNKFLNGNGNPADRPGHSDHQQGIAIDINLSGNALTWLKANGSDYGFTRPDRGEPWHWEFRPTEVASSKLPEDLKNKSYS